ncbi:DDE-type integrase/transposase/recombinase [Rhodoferax sp. BLA1]|uniref:Mu transposase C-terminal domain-containing protein n=1 Tax=Rhodoferax sp. BLA1 TaxID=2576062 RepID=UPI0015D3E818|nr:DDE-type integrase/transposase/recombinase [Rhodoferax sp. BLA1]
MARTATAFMQPLDPAQPLALRPVGQVVALRQRDPWREASDAQRTVAIARHDVVSYVLELERTGLSANRSIELMLTRHELGQLHPHMVLALKACAKAGRTAPTRNPIFEWRKVIQDGGSRVDLIEHHKGKVTNVQPAWWGPALEYFNNPSKPDMSTVWRRLTEVDGFACTYEQVRGYLTSVPAMVGRNSPARIGRNLYRLTEKAFMKRSTQNALPGDVYVADGYRADVYLAHPVTGKLFRPELTVAIDLRSRMVVGWRADEHEGTTAVQNMWAECFSRHRHVPLFLYIDNGSGYKNKLMSDEVVGFYNRAGVQQIIHAIPGNPHGKGWVERFFRIVKDDFLKLWMPQFYCGTDAAPEALSHTVNEVRAGRMQLPSLAQFTDAFNQWLSRYAQRPHPEDASRTRASLWAELVPVAPAGDVSELKRQAALLTVRRGMLQHGKWRIYRHPDLQAYNGTKVLLEYDLMDNTVAVVRTEQGRWICDAQLVTAIDAVDTTRMEEKRANRAADAVKRLEEKIAEQRARAGQVIDVEATAQAVIENDLDLLLDHAGLFLADAPLDFDDLFERSNTPTDDNPEGELA